MSTRKRILYLDDVTMIAGGANSFLTLFAGLDRTKYDLLLVCPEGPLAEAARALDVQTVDHTFAYPFFKVSFLGRRWLNPLPLLVRLKDAIWLSGVIRRDRVSLVHTNNLNSHISGLMAGWLTGVPVLWHIRTYWPSLLYRLALPDRLVFVSNAVMTAAFGGRGHPRAQVIHNGINIEGYQRVSTAYSDVRQELGLSQDEKLVGIVGRLCSTWKGHRYFLEAARLVLDRGVRARFVVVGDEVRKLAPLKQKLLDLTHELGLDETVIFTGFRRDVRRLMSSFDVLVSASKDDPNPRVVLEAMTVGVPIVGTLSGGVPEMLEDRVSGLLVPPEDSEQMADAIEALLTRPALAHGLAQAAQDRVRTCFHDKGHVKQVERVYEEMLSSRGVS